MKVSIETNNSRIVIEDAFSSHDPEKSSEHNRCLVNLAYQYIVGNDLMCEYENGTLVTRTRKAVQ